jgi:hypothetical protein
MVLHQYSAVERSSAGYRDGQGALRTMRRMQRLGSAIRAELTAIKSIERRADENRRVRYAVAVGFVSAVAIPASLILACLGINASQVAARRSMFSHQYLGMYLTVAAVIALGNGAYPIHPFRCAAAPAAKLTRKRSLVHPVSPTRSSRSEASFRTPELASRSFVIDLSSGPAGVR